MAKYIVAKTKGTIALAGDRAFLCPPAGHKSCEEIIMANQLENVTRRNFLSGTAGAIAASGATLLSGEIQAKMPELEQIAQALHEVAGQYSDIGHVFRYSIYLLNILEVLVNIFHHRTLHLPY